jgi:WD40 repeat protein
MPFMILGLEIGLLVAGLIALITGRLKLSKQRVATGAAARIAGLVFMLPLPLAVFVAVALSVGHASGGIAFNPDEWQRLSLVVELGLIGVCCLIGFGIAFSASATQTDVERSEKPERARPRPQAKTEPAPEPVLWAEPAEAPPAAIRGETPIPLPLARASGRESPRKPAGRAESAAAASSMLVWWIVGGVAAGLFPCMATTGGLVLLWFLARPSPAPSPVGPIVQNEGPVAQNAPAPGGNQEWGQEPRIRLPPDEAPPGFPMPDQKPPPVEKKKEPPAGLRAALDLGSAPTALALSPDGRTLAVASKDLALTFWDVAAARQRRRLPGNDKEVHALVFSPDGRWLASADTGPFAKLREAATGKQHASFHAGDNQHVSGLAFSPDSKTLVLAAGGVIKLCNLETGEDRDIFRGNADARETNISSAAFTAGGRQLYLHGIRNGPRGLEEAASLWEVATGRLVEDLRPFPGRTFVMSWMAPDGRHFLFGVPNQTILQVWDRTARRELTPLDGPTFPTGVAFAPDGESLVVGYADGQVWLWDYKKAKKIAGFEANREDEHLPGVLNDGIIQAWAVRGVAFAADGKFLVTGQSNGFKVWDADKVFGRVFVAAPLVPAPAPVPLKPEAPERAGVRELGEFRLHDKDLISLAVAPDGRTLAFCAGQAMLGAEPAEIKLWDAVTHKELARATGGGVAAFTPDGKHVLCALPLDLLNLGALAANGEDILSIELALRDARNLELRPGRVRCAGCALSPDGRKLLTAHMTTGGPVLKLFEMGTFKELHVWKHVQGGNVCGLAFAPDGKSFAVALTGKPVVHICDAADGTIRLTCTGHTGEIRALAYAPDGKRLATAGIDKSIRLWDTATGLVRTTLEGHTREITGLVYAHDARILVSAGGDGTIRLWDTTKEKEVATLELPPGDQKFAVLTLTPDGKMLAAGRGSSIRLWDVHALIGRPVVKPAVIREAARPDVQRPDAPPKPADPVAPPAPRPKKPEAPPAKPAPDKAPERAADKGQARELHRLPISKNSYVHALVFTPDGRELLSAGDDGRLRRWNVSTGKELPSSFDAHPRVSMLSIAVSADGKRMATAALDKTAKVWETATNKLVTTCSEKIGFVHAALSPDGKTLATGTNRVRLWDAMTGQSLGELTDRPSFIDALVFSSDGKRLACSGGRNTVKLWDVEAQKELATLTGHSRAVFALAFAPDGKALASASVDHTIKLWDLATNMERITLTEHADPVSSVAFSPDGSLLVSGAGATRVDPGHRGEVKLWDAATGALLDDLRGHQDGVSAVAFSPDGKTVASAGRDRTVRLWDVSAYCGRAAAPK